MLSARSIASWSEECDGIRSVIQNCIMKGCIKEAGRQAQRAALIELCAVSACLKKSIKSRIHHPDLRTVKAGRWKVM